jgi:hypothetical protein
MTSSATVTEAMHLPGMQRCRVNSIGDLSSFSLRIFGLVASVTATEAHRDAHRLGARGAAERKCGYLTNATVRYFAAANACRVVTLASSMAAMPALAESPSAIHLLLAGSNTLPIGPIALVAES